MTHAWRDSNKIDDRIRIQIFVKGSSAELKLNKIKFNKDKHKSYRLLNKPKKKKKSMA